MNLAIRGIEGQIAHGDSFHNDRHPDLRADYILANPPFNVSDWGGERLRVDRRWEYGAPPVGNANFRLGPALSCTTWPPEAWLGSCWPTAPCRPINLARGKSARTSSRLTWWTASSPCRGSSSGRPRYLPACGSFPRGGATATGGPAQGETLFVDARKMGHMLDRTRRDLSEEEISRIADTYHHWRDGGDYEDTYRGSARAPPWKKSAGMAVSSRPAATWASRLRKTTASLFKDKMARLAAQWREQQAEGSRLDAAIEENLARLGFPPDN